GWRGGTTARHLQGRGGGWIGRAGAGRGRHITGHGSDARPRDPPGFRRRGDGAWPWRARRARAVAPRCRRYGPGAMAGRVGVFGAGGRMGSTVCRAVAGDPELELVAAIAPHHAGLDLRQVTGVDVPDLDIAPDPSILLEVGAEVVVDFTVVEASRRNLEWAAEHGLHAVVGTTGFTPEDHERLRAAFTRSNCLLAPNFAIGAVLMMRFAEMAAPWFDTAEVIELHHDRKVDAPSGTAMMTVQRMAEASESWS